MTRVDGPRLLLAGDTRHVPADAVAAVDAAIAGLGPRARRLGHVAPSDLFDRVGLVVFPSVWSEPFGLVVADRYTIAFGQGDIDRRDAVAFRRRAINGRASRLHDRIQFTRNPAGAWEIRRLSP